MRMAAILGGLAFLAVACAAHASGTDDGNAGLTALQNGDNDGAIRLFTRAVNSHDLQGDDLEFAYANRGLAYLNKGDLPDAIADLDRARQMKPDDTDAQTNLIKAVSTELPATLLPGQSTRSMADQVGKAIGKSILSGITAGLQQGLQGN